ncbi:MAG: GspMb/PilO family protein [Planctomycetota bacterium]
MNSVYRKYLKTIALVWAGCFLLLFFIYMLVLAPHRKSKEQIEQRLAEKKQIYDSVVEMAQEETQQKLNKQIEDLRDRLKDFAIDFEDSANLTFDISRIASEGKLSSFGIKGKEGRGGSAKLDGKYIGENQINVDFESGFHEFTTFLNALERHSPVVFVDGFTITRSKQDSSGHQVSMNLSVFVRKRMDS